jgi:hypothetical protein
MERESTFLKMDRVMKEITLRDLVKGMEPFFTELVRLPTLDKSKMAYQMEEGR